MFGGEGRRPCPQCGKPPPQGLTTLSLYHVIPSNQMIVTFHSPIWASRGHGPLHFIGADIRRANGSFHGPGSFKPAEFAQETAIGTLGRRYRIIAADVEHQPLSNRNEIALLTCN